MDRRCDAFIASGLRAAVVANSGLSQASPGQVRLCSSLGLGARLSHLKWSFPSLLGFVFVHGDSLCAGSRRSFLLVW
jgi:hypothetical protein